MSEIPPHRSADDRSLLKPEQAIGFIDPGQFVGPLPPADRELISQEIQTFHAGPLPPPEVLAGYEQVLAGLADRMVKMAEKEQHQRHEQDRRLLDASIADAVAERRQIRWGQTCGLTVCIVALLTGLGMVVWGNSAGSGVAGGVVSTASLVALVTAFMRGQKVDADNMEKKRSQQKHAPVTPPESGTSVAQPNPPAAK